MSHFHHHCPNCAWQDRLIPATSHFLSPGSLAPATRRRISPAVAATTSTKKRERPSLPYAACVTISAPSRVTPVSTAELPRVDTHERVSAATATYISTSTSSYSALGVSAAELLLSFVTLNCRACRNVIYYVVYHRRSCNVKSTALCMVIWFFRATVLCLP